MGDFPMLRDSRGTVVAMSGAELSETTRIVAAGSGVFPRPEGAATHAAQARLLKSGWRKGDETVVLFNAGTSLKHIYLWQ
jgi:threonine synthase